MKTDWAVLLIGGSSGVGKSHLARQLSEHYKAPLTEVDDIRIALQQIAAREKYPDLFYFVDNPNFLEKLTEEAFAEKLLSVGEVVWKSLQVLISKHIALKEKVIFEGDGIIPNLLSEANSSGVKAVFVYDDIESIKNRQSERNRHGEASKNIEKNSLCSFTYGEEIRKQAESNGFLVIKASPIDTLFERVIAMIK